MLKGRGMNNGVLKYGASTFASMDAATANFVGASINTLSLCCTPIELLSNDGDETIVSTASGFFWSHEGSAYLVTNWHVVTGKNPFTGQVLSKQGYVPQKFAYYGVAYVLQDGLLEFIRERRVVTLTEAALRLFENPPLIDGQSVDIVPIAIPAGVVFGKNPAASGFSGAEKTTCFINEAGGQRIVTRAGDDCFILGYPLQNYEGLNLPIWKRGAISSDTNIGVGGRPIFLVDAATTPAMSGAPIVRKVGGFPVENRNIGAIEEFSAFDMIGVYAGRLESKELAATNIGYGWYKSLLPKLIDDLYRQQP